MVPILSEHTSISRRSSNRQMRMLPPTSVSFLNASCVKIISLIASAAGQRALARPWNNQSRVVYTNTYMVSPVCSLLRIILTFIKSDILDPQGFVIWQASDPRVCKSSYLDMKSNLTSRSVPNLTFFIVSGSYGPGYNPSARNYPIESVNLDSASRGAVFGQ